MISIIIPAHNEARVIRRCLDQVTNGLEPGEAEVIVVCNGCSDGTAEVARAFGEPVRVLETPVPSKVHALNLGDEAATGYPRVYMDADIRLEGRTIRQLAEVLGRGPCLAVAPSLEMDLDHSGWLVRAYYRVWTMLPYTREGFMGVGAYAMSEAGRRRFGSFPEVIADDGYVRMLFTPDERVAVSDCVSVVKGPAKVWDLIRIKTRSRLGLHQLRRRFPELSSREAAGKQYGTACRDILFTPRLWLYAPVYLGVNLISKYRARRQMDRIEHYVWERDESSRVEKSPCGRCESTAGGAERTMTKRSCFGGNGS